MKTFPSKILLFGEHIINLGANGLAAPFQSYSSCLDFNKTIESLAESKTVLELIYNQICTSNKLTKLFDKAQFKTDIENRLYINMNIPIGYGLGSSGAVCASIYDRYAKNKTNNPKMLKNILGEMEGAFHGKSSGLDPLVSYLEKSILVSQKETKIVNFKLKNIKEFSIFLVDTKQARKTAPLVTKFLKICEEQPKFKEQIVKKIIPLNNEIITDFVGNQLENTYAKIAELSKLHLEHFSFLILEKHKTIWKKALEQEDFFLKICGAGGGGFMLGFYKDKKKVLAAFDQKQLIFI